MKAPQPIEVTPEDLYELLERYEKGERQEGDYEIIKALIDMIIFLSSQLQEKEISIKRLLRMIFGSSTEKTDNVLKDKGNDEKKSDSKEDKSSSGSGKEEDSKNKADEKKKRKGHGRNGVEAYTGADKISIAHLNLKPGDPCPLCGKGKVYKLKIPAVVVRVKCQAPVKATVYELERLRCNLCGKVFTAEPPESCGEKKYDETAGSMIALLKYGSGFPFYRLEKLQDSLGVPLPDSDQWEIVEKKADLIYPAYDELVRQAAQGEVLHNDDTNMKILDLMDNGNHEEEQEGDEASRTGMFTTAILSIKDGRKIALFFTGRNHAGENMADVLKNRESDRGPPIQMCDALSRNLPKDFEVILANCSAHARRKFVDITAVFPEECRFVLETFKEVYKNDQVAKDHNMSKDERLRYHQTESGPLMEKLETWLREQFDEKRVEPNSSLGQAISYMLNHWKALTLFLRVPGAPLDNNICEQALKKVILHRKNALFYKTEHGAYIGDMYMSLIHTCILCGVNPFEYLTELEKHSSEVFKNPQKWLPWNYKQNLHSD